MLKRLCELHGANPEATMLTLCRWRHFHRSDGAGNARASHSSPHPWKELRKVGWLDGDDRLCGFGLHAAQSALALGPQDKLDDLASGDLREAVRRLCEALLAQTETDRSRILDASIAWLSVRAAGGRASGQFKARNELASIGDPIAPIPVNQRSETASQFLERGRGGNVTAAVAGLNLQAHSRHESTEMRLAGRRDFIEALEW